MARTTGSLSRYVVQRIALVIPMVWILLTLVFFVLRVVPGDPVSAALGGRLSPSALAARRHQLGLDRPLINQYFSYLGDVARGRFGTTFTDKQPVIDVIKNNGGATLTLTVAAFLVALGVGIPLGRLAARYRDSPLDVGVRLFGIVTYAAPVFFIGLLAKLLFAVKLNWVDPSGMASPITIFEVPTRTHILLVDAILAGNTSAVTDVLSHLVLPAATLGLLICGIFIRLIRVNLLQTLQGDYVEAARARGIPESRVIRKHAFRNALVPVITVIGLQVALLMSGAVLTERTFNWPGLGDKLVTYIEGRDYGAVQGIIVFFALVVVVVSVIIDIVNALIDPRVVLMLRRIWRVVATPFTETVGLAQWMLVVGLVITGAFVVLAIFAPWIAPYGYAQVSAHGHEFPKLQHPGHGHVFGTNDLLYDVFSRMIWGSRTALEVVVMSVVIAVVTGVPLGLVSGYLGGWTDRILVLIMDTVFSFPSLLLAIVFAFVLKSLIGSSVLAVALSLTAIYVPQYFRVVRDTTISAKEATYVEAARAIGAPAHTIMGRYLFGNVIQSVPVIGTLNAADAISTLAALGFIGLGVQPQEAAEWGFDLSRATDDAAAGIWWTGLYPGLAIVLLIVGLTLVGEGLNETINPTLRKRRFSKIVMPATVGAGPASVAEGVSGGATSFDREAGP